MWLPREAARGFLYGPDGANAISSKTDPPLAKDEQISRGSSASVVTCLGRGTPCCTTTSAAKERSEDM